MEKKKRVGKIVTLLKKRYPDAKCSLTYRSPLDLLIATVLSAQCTDVRVNLVTPALFKAYPTAQTMATAPVTRLETLVKTTGFFRNKAKNIQGAARLITQNFDGQVPDTMDQLLTLPGVARKTANVVLGNAFGKNVGVVVDTHVGRLAVRLNLTQADAKNAVQVERDLIALFPTKHWTLLSHLFIAHGRAACKARNPQCDTCPLKRMCAVGRASSSLDQRI